MSGQMNGQSRQLERDTLCTVELKAEQWEIVLQILGKAPYEVSAPIIQSIIPQVMNGRTPSPGQEIADVQH